MDQAAWTNRKKSAVWRPNCENENSPANRPSSNTGITVLLWVSIIVTDRILIIFPVIKWSHFGLLWIELYINIKDVNWTGIIGRN